MEKRYQVFVSSTYLDLKEARNEVMQALLELDCMPAGMELFPAANDQQWDWIKKVIDESDYYIVIVGGRYGSISKKTGKSYTEMEYRYALEKNKPIVAFLHENPSSLPARSCESSARAQKKLEEFCDLLKKKLCKFWKDPSDLGSKVSRSMVQLTRQWPATGWIRADQIPMEASSEEILKLKRINEQLEAELNKLRAEGPRGTETLAKSKDIYTVKFSFRRKKKNEKNFWVIFDEASSDIKLSWDDLFKYLAPSLLDGMDERDVARKMNSLIESYSYKAIEKKYLNERFCDFYIYTNCLNTIIMQFRALKLIERIEIDDYRKEWKLTEYGDEYMTKLIAVHKDEISKPEDNE